MHARTPHCHGFTLTELLITLAIAGIVATLAAPTFGNLLTRTRSANAENAIAAGLHAARNAAVEYGARVVMCPSTDARHCRSGDDWQHGWLIATDNDHDGQPDAIAAILGTQAALPADMRVVTSDGRGSVTFQPTGSAGGSNVRFTICQRGQTQGKAIIVANSGRIRLADAQPDHVQACRAGL